MSEQTDPFRSQTEDDSRRPQQQEPPARPNESELSVPPATSSAPLSPAQAPASLSPSSTPSQPAGAPPAWAPVVQNPYARFDPAPPQGQPRPPQGPPAQQPRSYNPAEYSAAARPPVNEPPPAPTQFPGEGMQYAPPPERRTAPVPPEQMPPQYFPPSGLQPQPGPQQPGPGPQVQPRRDVPPADPAQRAQPGIPQTPYPGMDLEGRQPGAQRPYGDVRVPPQGPGIPPPGVAGPRPPVPVGPVPPAGAQRPMPVPPAAAPVGPPAQRPPVQQAPMPQVGPPPTQSGLPVVPPPRQAPPPQRPPQGSFPQPPIVAAPNPQQQWQMVAAEGAMAAGAAGPYALRSTQTRRCPYCASTVPAGAVACPVCRSDLQTRPHSVRCRSCRGRAPGNLALCPHCGVELRAAPPRWLTMLVPSVLGVMVIALVAVSSSASGEAAGFTGPFAGVRSWLAEMSAMLDPQVTVIPPAEGPALASAATPGAVQVVAPETDSSMSAAESPNSGFEGGPPGGVAVTDTIAATVPVTGDAASVAPADQPAPSAAATALPVVTPAATPTQAPTETPTAEPTAVPTVAPTQPQLTHTIQRGDTPLGIASRYGIDVDRLLAANGLDSGSATALQVGQTLLIPSTPAPVNFNPNATPVPGIPYTVRAGDTLVGISVRVGVPLADLMAANGLTEATAASLRPDDVLIIPAPTPAPSLPTPTPLPPTPTPQPTATPTFVPTATPNFMPTATPAAVTPAATATPSVAMRFAAPQLVSPANGATLACADAVRLQWSGMANLGANDRFRIHLGFVQDRSADGTATVKWAIDQVIPSGTVAAAPAELCNAAPKEMGNEWRWYVDIVDVTGGASVPVSPPSAEWRFVWK